MSKELNLAIILNPVAGKGRAERLCNELIQVLRRRKLPFHLEKTRYPGHATELANKLSKEFEVLISAGGDGTLNEITNGLINRNTLVAILPVGSGNDLNKVIGMPKRVNTMLDIILNKKTKLIDIGKVKLFNSDGYKIERKFLNFLGIGLDAEIAREMQTIKYVKGLPAYIISAIKSFIKYEALNYKIVINGRIIKEKAMFIYTANGCFEGGGFRLAPNAKLTDGKLNFKLIRSMGFFRTIALLPKFINGNIGKEENISVCSKGNMFKIIPDKPTIIHIDGEVISDHTTLIEIDIAKEKLKIISP